MRVVATVAIGDICVGKRVDGEFERGLVMEEVVGVPCGVSYMVWGVRMSRVSWRGGGGEVG